MDTRGDRKLGTDGFRGASWNDASRQGIRGALGGEEPRGSSFPGHRQHGQPFQHHLQYYSMVC